MTLRGAFGGKNGTKVFGVFIPWAPPAGATWWVAHRPSVFFPESSAKGHRYFLSEDQCRQSRAVFSIFSLLKARAPSDLSLSVRSGRARNLWTATKQVLKARIWTRISESSIVFHGDSENRSPEADFGLPGAENPTFSIFHFSEFSNSRSPLKTI